MEAIDTVMSPEERIKFDKRFTTGSVNLKGLAEAQAGISFPKGEKQGIDKGRKEVVEWIDRNGIIHKLFEEDWQAFKKKLGL